MLAMWVELFWGAAEPAAAEEEDDGWAGVGCFVAFGVEDV